MINRNRIKNKKFNIKITVNAKKIYYHNCYNLLNLEKDGFIQDNGNLIIICSIQNNNNLYDIDEYYERNMKKELKNIKGDNNINYNEKKLPYFRGLSQGKFVFVKFRTYSKEASFIFYY